MNKIAMCMCGALAALPLVAVELTAVSVRQLWPWSANVKVTYTISGVTEPVNVRMEAFNGARSLDCSRLYRSASGPRYAIAADGTYSFTFDPRHAFGEIPQDLSDFRVRLTTEPAAAILIDKIYRIVNLADGSSVDLSRAEIMNGGYGTYETDFSYVGTTTLSDVFIWTGITNDVKYMTTHMAFRKIPVANQEFALGGSTKHRAMVTKDFWMGVLEVTQSQLNRLVSHTSSITNADYATTRPADTVGFHTVRGSTLGKKWADGVDLATARQVDPGSALGVLRTRTNDNRYDLPTQTQWEIACRAGTTSELYNGRDANASSSATVSEDLGTLCRYKWNGGMADGYDREIGTTGGVYYSAETRGGWDLSRGTLPVGSKLPNAYGLYDMLGNVSELVLDIEKAVYDAETLYVNPMGGPVPSGTLRRLHCGGSWDGYVSLCLSSSAGTQAPISTPLPGQGVRFCITEE